jgi:hypothetical protein
LEVAINLATTQFTQQTLIAYSRYEKLTTREPVLCESASNLSQELPP